MGKSAGKPGEMRYTGDVGTGKGPAKGETFRDGKNREWQQMYGEGTPKIVSPSKKYAKGGVVRGYGAARGAKKCKGA